MTNPKPARASARRPTVLHLLLASDAGGLSKYVIDLHRPLLQSGWDVIVAGDVGAWHDRFESAKIEYLKLPLKSGYGGLRKSLAILRDQLADRPIDLIHTHYRRATLLARKLQRNPPWPGPLQRPRGIVPILYTLHLTHIHVTGWRRFLTDFGDLTHLASRDAIDWTTRVARVPEERTVVIPHGIDVSRWPVTTPGDRAQARREMRIDPDSTVMLFVGRLDDPKNEDWVIEAHRVARRSNPKLVTLLVGDGPHRARLESSLPEGVRLLGERDPIDAYRAADLFVLPSSREGFSYVCCEAMSTGLPVLRTRTTGTSETVVEDVTGRSVPIDREAFVRAAVELLSDPSKLRSMGQAGAIHARNQLTFDRQLSSTLDLYFRLTNLWTDGHRVAKSTKQDTEDLSVRHRRN